MRARSGIPASARVKSARRSSLQRNVGIMLDIGVYGREIIVARILQAAACEIDENNGVRPRLRRLPEEILEGAAQRLLIEIGRARDVEAGPAQGLGDESRVIGGGRQRIGVLRIADDEREARPGVLGVGRAAGKKAGGQSRRE